MINNEKKVKEFFDNMIYHYKLSIDLIDSAVSKSINQYIESTDNPTYDGYLDYIDDESPIIYDELQLKINERTGFWQFFRESIDEWLDLEIPKEWQDELFDFVYNKFSYYDSDDQFKTEADRGDHDPKTL